jgi:hypothetical protein
MKVLIPLLLVIAGGWSLQQWYHDRYEDTPALQPGPARPAAEVSGGNLHWLRDWFGSIGEPPHPAVLRADLARWNTEMVEGWEHLSRPGFGPAARAEIARWLEMAAAESAHASELIVAPTADGRAVDLKLTLIGPPAALLPWLHHLLSQPQHRGYLTDPQRLRFLHLGEEGVAANLTIRVLPAAALLPAAGGG